MITAEYLIDMMFDSKPISDFEKVFNYTDNKQAWEELLDMCYWEFSYVSVGGDEGYLENPPIDYKKLEYLENLIVFLEAEGVKIENTAPKVKST